VRLKEVFCVWHVLQELAGKRWNAKTTGCEADGIGTPERPAMR
jgi:hypothetical protein